ncbi:MAG: carbohydrate kinase family protein [Patescibacteria group bacterium]
MTPQQHPHRPRTMSIGGATYDLFVRLPHEKIHSDEKSPFFTLPLGEKIRVKDVIETCGGGAGNTSVGLSRLGCDASICSVVGADQWGDALQKNFQNEGVDTKSLTVIEDEMTSFSIILSGSGGERVILYDPGTNEHMHDALFDKASAAEVDWIILNHIHEQACVIEDDLIEILVQKDTRLTWNPGGCQIDAGIKGKSNTELLKSTTLLVLNKEEAMRFTGEQSVDAAMKTLLKSGVAHVCITDGSRGTVASDGKKLYRCPVDSEAKVIDTTGAGDAFTTGVTWALLNGKTLPEALIAGTINSGNVVGAIGAEAGLLTDIEIVKRMQSTSLSVSTL